MSMAPTLRSTSSSSRPRREYPAGYRPRNPMEEIDMFGELSENDEEISSEEEQENETHDDDPLRPTVTRGILIPENLSIIPGNTPNSDSTNDIPVFATNPNVFECPVCYDTLTIPIYQCINGHIVCSNCFSKINNTCPFCLIFMKKDRCRAMETVLESMKATCVNAKFGCKERILFSEKREHEKKCSYVQFKCPIPGCNWLSCFGLLPLHLGLEHAKSITTFQYGKFFNVTLRCCMKYIVLQALSDKKLFIIHSQCVGWGSAVSLRHIGPTRLFPREILYEAVKIKTREALLLPTSVTTVNAEEPLGNPMPSLTLPSFQIPGEKFCPEGRYIVRLRITPNPNFSAIAATFSGEETSTSSRAAGGT